LDRLEQLDSLMTHHSNYVEYRNILHTSDPPCVPFFGLFLFFFQEKKSSRY